MTSTGGRRMMLNSINVLYPQSPAFLNWDPERGDWPCHYFDPALTTMDLIYRQLCVSMPEKKYQGTIQKNDFLKEICGPLELACSLIVSSLPLIHSCIFSAMRTP